MTEGEKQRVIGLDQNRKENSMIMATPHSRTAPSFAELLTRSRRYSNTRGSALDHGFNEQALLRYANGAVSDDERKHAEQIVLRNDWSCQFVVRHIKHRRERVAE